MHTRHERIQSVHQEHRNDAQWHELFEFHAQRQQQTRHGRRRSRHGGSQFDKNIPLRHYDHHRLGWQHTHHVRDMFQSKV